MALNTREKDDVVIIVLSGQLTRGAPTAMLRHSVTTHLDSGKRKFVIDLENVSSVDSAGLGELIVSQRTIVNRGGRLSLLKPTTRIKERLEMTKLATILDVYEAEATAVAAVQNAAS